MTPFEQFYANTFKPALDALEAHDSGPVFSDGSGIAGASWDRKAAFLLWHQTLWPPSYAGESAKPAADDPW